MIQHKPKCKTCHKIILKQCESIEVDIKYIILIFNSKIQIGGRKVKKGERKIVCAKVRFDCLLFFSIQTNLLELRNLKPNPNHDSSKNQPNPTRES